MEGIPSWKLRHLWTGFVVVSISPSPIVRAVGPCLKASCKMSPSGALIAQITWISRAAEGAGLDRPRPDRPRPVTCGP